MLLAFVWLGIAQCLISSGLGVGSVLGSRGLLLMVHRLLCTFASKNTYHFILGSKPSINKFKMYKFIVKYVCGSTCT